MSGALALPFLCDSFRTSVASCYTGCSADVDEAGGSGGGGGGCGGGGGDSGGVGAQSRHEHRCNNALLAARCTGAAPGANSFLSACVKMCQGLEASWQTPASP